MNWTTFHEKTLKIQKYYFKLKQLTPPQKNTPPKLLWRYRIQRCQSWSFPEDRQQTRRGRKMPHHLPPLPDTFADSPWPAQPSLLCSVICTSPIPLFSTPVVQRKAEAEVWKGKDVMWVMVRIALEHLLEDISNSVPRYLLHRAAGYKMTWWQPLWPKLEKATGRDGRK